MVKKKYFGINKPNNKIIPVSSSLLETKLPPDIEKELRKRQALAEVKNLKDPKVKNTENSE